MNHAHKQLKHSSHSQVSKITFSPHQFQCLHIQLQYSLEVKVLESEVGLHNTGGLHSGPQDILLSWDIGRTGYSV